MIRAPFLYPADDPAGDLCAGVPGGLRCKIVRAAVDHNRSAHYIVDTKSACHHRKVRLSIRRQQGRKIPGMVWMSGIAGIVVPAGIGKPIPLAVPTFMDVESEKTSLRIRQAANIRDHENAVTPLKKPDGPMEPRVGVSAAHIRGGCRYFVPHHPITSYKAMRSGA